MIRAIASMLLLTVTLCACQTGPFSRNTSDEELANELLQTDGGAATAPRRFDDVPVPKGAKEDTERTYTFESNSLQIGRMVYTVKDSPNNVAQFYIRECANLGWSLETALQANGVILEFNRPGIRLWVTTQPTGIANRSTLLILNYTPDTGSGPLSSNPLQTPPL
ncbi:MAG: hypothetical protein VCD00_02555 [Candidatus Hydrogenedentota bacterium]